jgi:hypothetical protein
MSVTITAVPKIAGPNPPGLVLVIVLFADQIISMEEIHFNGRLAANPVLLEGTNVYAFFTSELGASYDCTPKRGDAGEIYDHQVNMNYVSPEDLADPVFRKFKNREFILLTMNMHGRRHLIGTKEQPLRCSIKKSTGSDSGMYGYKIDFQGETYYPAPLFIGDFAAGTIQPPTIEQMQDFSPFDFSNLDFY